MIELLSDKLAGHELFDKQLLVETLEASRVAFIKKPRVLEGRRVKPPKEAEIDSRIGAREDQPVKDRQLLQDILQTMRDGKTKGR